MKQMAFMKERVAFSIYNQTDAGMKAKRMLGLEEEQSKMSVKQRTLDELWNKEVDHHLSPHPKSLQKSRYLTIDANLNKDKLLGKAYSKKFKTMSKSLQTNIDIPLRFTHQNEISKKRMRGIMSLCKFSAKMNTLKRNGSKLELVNKMRLWIEDNIETLYGDPGLQKLFGTNSNLKDFQQSKLHVGYLTYD